MNYQLPEPEQNYTLYKSNIIHLNIKLIPNIKEIFNITFYGLKYEAITYTLKKLEGSDKIEVIRSLNRDVHDNCINLQYNGCLISIEVTKRRKGIENAITLK